MHRSRSRPDSAQLPADPGSLICVAPRQALDRSEPDTSILFIPVSDALGSLLPPWHGPPHPCLARGALSREEGAGGLGRRHPGRPPGLMQEKSQGGKISSLSSRSPAGSESPLSP